MPHFFLLCLINEAVIYAKTYLKIKKRSIKMALFYISNHLSYHRHDEK